MNALDVGACTWLPDASSRWPGRGENKAHGCFDRVTKSTKTRKQKKRKLPWLHEASDQQGRWDTAHSAPDLGGEFQSQAGGSISAARLIEMGFRRGEQNYIYITTMQNRELLFKYRIFLGLSTLEEFFHRRLCTDVSFSTCGNQYRLFLWGWDWCL